MEVSHQQQMCPKCSCKTIKQTGSHVSPMSVRKPHLTAPQIRAHRNASGQVADTVMVELLQRNHGRGRLIRNTRNGYCGNLDFGLKSKFKKTFYCCFWSYFCDTKWIGDICMCGSNRKTWRKRQLHLFITFFCPQIIHFLLKMVRPHFGPPRLKPR